MQIATFLVMYKKKVTADKKSKFLKNINFGKSITV